MEKMNIKLSDLNKHLFAQLERLSDETKNQHELTTEIDRTKAIVKISEQIIDSSTIKLQAAKLVAQNGGANYEQLLPEDVQPYNATIIKKSNKEEKLIPDYSKDKMV